MGKLLSIVLLIGGALVGIILIWLMNLYVAEGRFTQTTAIVAAGLGILLFVLPQWGLGIYLLIAEQVDQETTEFRHRQQQLLDTLQASRQISFEQLADQFNQSPAEMQQMVSTVLAERGWTGYINWKEGMLYSQQTNELVHLTRCPTCGGEIEPGSHISIQCPGCKSEFFLN